MIRIGQGYDVHQLVEGRPLILGGSKFHMTKACLDTQTPMFYCTQ